MRSTINIAIVAGVMAGFGCFPMAANAAPIRYECDTADGANSEIVQQQAGPNYALQADISAWRFGKHRDRRPGAKIQIKSADGMNSVGIQLSAGVSKPPAAAVSLISTNGGEQKQYLVTTVKLGESVRASIRIKDGVVQAEVAGQVADVPVQIGRSAEVAVGCSTGQFMFDKLSLGAAN